MLNKDQPLCFWICCCILRFFFGSLMSFAGTGHHTKQSSWQYYKCVQNTFLIHHLCINKVLWKYFTFTVMPWCLMMPKSMTSCSTPIVPIREVPTLFQEVENFMELKISCGGNACYIPGGGGGGVVSALSSYLSPFNSTLNSIKVWTSVPSFTDDPVIHTLHDSVYI